MQRSPLSGKGFQVGADAGDGEIRNRFGAAQSHGLKRDSRPPGRRHRIQTVGLGAVGDQHHGSRSPLGAPGRDTPLQGRSKIRGCSCRNGSFQGFQDRTQPGIKPPEGQRVGSPQFVPDGCHGAEQLVVPGFGVHLPRELQALRTVEKYEYPPGGTPGKRETQDRTTQNNDEKHHSRRPEGYQNGSKRPRHGGVGLAVEIDRVGNQKQCDGNKKPPHIPGGIPVDAAPLLQPVQTGVLSGSSAGNAEDGRGEVRRYQASPVLSKIPGNAGLFKNGDPWRDSDPGHPKDPELIPPRLQAGRWLRGCDRHDAYCRSP